jgi:hypothetical protein
MADFTPRSKLLKDFASDKGFSCPPTCMHEHQFLFGCVEHFSIKTELAIVQSILLERMESWSHWQSVNLSLQQSNLVLILTTVHR